MVYSLVLLKGVVLVLLLSLSYPLQVFTHAPLGNREDHIYIFIT